MLSICTEYFNNLETSYTSCIVNCKSLQPINHTRVALLMFIDYYDDCLLNVHQYNGLRLWTHRWKRRNDAYNEYKWVSLFSLWCAYCENMIMSLDNIIFYSGLICKQREITVRMEKKVVDYNFTLQERS